MEICSAQADIPEKALTLERGVGIGEAGIIGHREGKRNPVKPPSFQEGSHELFPKKTLTKFKVITISLQGLCH
jgi:hypothetical protein